MDDIIINKSATIQHCLKRIEEEYVGKEEEFDSNFTQQDAIILNLQRACQAAIDLATHVVRIKRLGVPQMTRDVFSILEKDKTLSSEISHHMQAMVGFRNLAIHDYQALNLEIVKSILTSKLTDFTDFIREIEKKMR